LNDDRQIDLLKRTADAATDKFFRLRASQFLDSSIENHISAHGLNNTQEVLRRYVEQLTEFESMDYK
jgi:hypothetical protein